MLNTVYQTQKKITTDNCYYKVVNKRLNWLGKSQYWCIPNQLNCWLPLQGSNLSAQLCFKVNENAVNWLVERAQNSENLTYKLTPDDLALFNLNLSNLFCPAMSKQQALQLLTDALKKHFESPQVFNRLGLTLIKVECIVHQRDAIDEQNLRADLQQLLKNTKGYMEQQKLVNRCANLYQELSLIHRYMENFLAVEKPLTAPYLKLFILVSNILTDLQTGATNICTNALEALSKEIRRS